MLSLPSIDDPVRAVLDTQVRELTKCVGYANIAVAIGVALEGSELLYRFINWIKRKIRERRERIAHEAVSRTVPVGELIHAPETHSEEPTWLKTILFIGLIGVVGGVVAEWRYGTKLEDAHDAVHLYDLGKLTAAESQIEQLRKTNNELDAKLHRAKERRHLTAQEKTRLAAILAPFHLKGLGGVWLQGDDEVTLFGNDLEDVFKNKLHLTAGHGLINTALFPSSRVLMPPGITIRVNNPRRPPPTASALKKFLDDLDFISQFAEPRPTQPTVALPSDRLTVDIGMR
jgi:hypothetical protein